MQEAEHHGDRWFKDAVEQGKARAGLARLKEAIYRETGQRLGETGTFTDGALTPDDEGELRFAVSAVGGKVVLAFGKQIEWIGLTPKIARELADALNKYAGQC